MLRTERFLRIESLPWHGRSIYALLRLVRFISVALALNFRAVCIGHRLQRLEPRTSVHVNVVCVYRAGAGSWWRGTVVERRSLAGELSLSCA